MHAFTHDEIQAGYATRIHAARTAELAAEAAAAGLAREAAGPRAPFAPALRNRMGEALVRTGRRLMAPVEPARLHTRAAG
ncbi:hypothetical protein AB0F11_20255 [Streptomyces sp. NPDC032472]|uniref:hypothetical protein n=1 Tax=Streptomyces sp. NPDC032472 TaxID=3155018 RepID=UPI0033F3415C